jgi:hypothetical protein
MVKLFGIEVEEMERVVWRILPGLLLILLLTGCFGGGGEEAAAPTPAPTGQTVVTCSDACAQQGQCGTTGDGRQLVLGRRDVPETQNHDLVFPTNAPVSVQATNIRTLQPPGGQPFPQGFSLISLNENGKTGWVSDLCIATLPAQ